MGTPIRFQGDWHGWFRRNRRAPWKLLVQGADKETVRLRLRALAGIDGRKEDCDGEVMLIEGPQTPDEVLAGLTWKAAKARNPYLSRWDA